MGYITSKDSVLSTAKAAASAYTDAAGKCRTAVAELQTQCQSVAANWQGESGTAMYNALESLCTELQSIAAGLDSLAGGCTSRGWSLYNSWPEKETEDKEKNK